MIAPPDADRMVRRRIELTVLPEGYTAPKVERQLCEAVSEAGVYVHDGYTPLPKGRNKAVFKDLHFIPYSDIQAIRVLPEGEW